MFNSAFIRAVLAIVLLGTAAVAAQSGPAIHMIYMGGNDCPPCRAWRTFELPKLQQTAIFEQIKFSHVEKTIQSSVPPRLFLPDEVKPYKDQLDFASGGSSGSSQIAILVNGKVFDYYFGSTRSAADVERMLVSIRDGTPYPYRRCLKARSFWSCEVEG